MGFMLGRNRVEIFIPHHPTTFFGGLASTAAYKASLLGLFIVRRGKVSWPLIATTRL